MGLFQSKVTSVTAFIDKLLLSLRQLSIIIMATTDLAVGLQSLSLTSPELLLFKPDESTDFALDDIPRYLFRVFTPHSRGTTDSTLTKSMDAKYENPAYKVDIFSRDDKHRVAGMINRHLRWFPGPEDNLVSWTSSLLFALIYIFHLHANTTDASPFEEISLCIVDAAYFPRGTFVQDMGLIKAYVSFDTTLRVVKGWREGSLYFGEFLSQGAPKIEDRCRIVSAQALIDNGLYDLRSEFRDFSHWQRQRRPPWAIPTLQLREALNEIGEQGQDVTENRLRAAMRIARLFGPGWRLPFAASLMSFVPHPSDDSRALIKFRAKEYTSRSLYTTCLKLKTDAEKMRRDRRALPWKPILAHATRCRNWVNTAILCIQCIEIIV